VAIEAKQNRHEVKSSADVRRGDLVARKRCDNRSGHKLIQIGIGCSECVQGRVHA